jgi:hypothetical protein
MALIQVKRGARPRLASGVARAAQGGLPWTCRHSGLIASLGRSSCQASLCWNLFGPSRLVVGRLGKQHLAIAFTFGLGRQHNVQNSLGSRAISAEEVKIRNYLSLFFDPCFTVSESPVNPAKFIQFFGWGHNDVTVDRVMASMGVVDRPNKSNLKKQSPRSLPISLVRRLFLARSPEQPHGGGIQGRAAGNK